MKKPTTSYRCSSCGEHSTKWQGQCPSCKDWNTLEEVAAPVSRGSSKSWTGVKTQVIDLADAQAKDTPRFTSGDPELDRVLGGGFVPGSILLVGGDPGIGKSTLLLQVCAGLLTEQRVLYVTGEESDNQVALRAKRMGLSVRGLKLMADTSLEAIQSACATEKPTLMVVDSIQTLTMDGVDSAAGSPTQVRECAAQLVRLAKATGVAIVLIGHVTKEGQIAGPRVLEHMVDAVMYFEGDASGNRLLRAFKNRFGSTGELGLYRMESQGLTAICNPSELFMTERDSPVPGVCSFPSMEGQRPVIVEIQALYEPAQYGGTPARRCVGFDPARLSMLLAVMDNQLKTTFGAANIYVNVVGGLKLADPAADLAVVVALLSAFKKQATPTGMVAFGEVGLTGEIRRVPYADVRLAEAKRLGFMHTLGPRGSKAKIELSVARGLMSSLAG